MHRSPTWHLLNREDIRSYWREHDFRIEELVAFCEPFERSLAQIPRQDRRELRLVGEYRNAAKGLRKAAKAIEAALRLSPPPWHAPGGTLTGRWEGAESEALRVLSPELAALLDSVSGQQPPVEVRGDLVAAINRWAKWLERRCADASTNESGITPRHESEMTALQMMFRIKWFRFAMSRTGKALDPLGSLLYGHVFNEEGTEPEFSEKEEKTFQKMRQRDVRDRLAGPLYYHYVVTPKGTQRVIKRASKKAAEPSTVR